MNVDNDLLEDIKTKMHYEHISDLRNIARDARENLESVLLLINPCDYSVKQWQELSHYLFPKLCIQLPSDAKKLRDNIVLAIVEYKKIIRQISEGA